MGYGCCKMVEKHFLVKVIWVILSLIPIQICAQTRDVQSLDEYFAGVSLNAGFENWVTFFSTDKYLGLDSSNERGIYSSIKPGRSDYFPYSSKYQVKFLFDKEIVYPLKNSGLPVDTAESIFIESIFPPNKSGKKAMDSCFKKLFKELKHYYKQNDENGPTIFFYNGINKKFPDLLFERAYSEKHRFYYVLLSYTRSKWIGVEGLKIGMDQQ